MGLKNILELNLLRRHLIHKRKHSLAEKIGKRWLISLIESYPSGKKAQKSMIAILKRKVNRNLKSDFLVLNWETKIILKLWPQAIPTFFLDKPPMYSMPLIIYATQNSQTLSKLWTHKKYLSWQLTLLWVFMKTVGIPFLLLIAKKS